MGAPDFYLIHTGPEAAPGIHGSVSQRVRPAGGGVRTGYECTIAVTDLGAIRASILANGGRIVLEEHEIVGVGRLIRFEDSEGNVVCAMHYEESS